MYYCIIVIFTDVIEIIGFILVNNYSKITTFKLLKSLGFSSEKLCRNY